MKKTQLEKVKAQLDDAGYVTRNWCLQNSITRLSAIVYTLKKMGYSLKTQFIKGDRDYVYSVEK